MSCGTSEETAKSPEDLQSEDQKINRAIMEEAFKLVKMGEEKINLCTEHENVVLVLGSTGTGKSTFTRWIAGDETLVGKKISAGEYLIKGDGISDSTIYAETIFPELVIDQTSAVAFCDCPGFGDTRGLSHDLATTYLIKRVADNSRYIKMIFTANYTSVREGGNRTELMSLMRHIVYLLKGIDKFRESISLVVTKVENLYEVTDDDKPQLISDETIIKNIGEFLQHAKEDLKNKIASASAGHEKKFREAAIKILDIFLSKTEEKKYTKIGIFRRPSKEGSLSKSKDLQKAKNDIKSMVFDKLKYAENARDCFGYGLSEKSKNDISDIVRDINDNLWSTLSELSKQLQEYFRVLQEDIQTKLQSFAAVTDNEECDKRGADIFSFKFSKGSFVINKLIKQLKGLKDPEEIISIINDGISDLDTDISSVNMLLIKNEGKYLNFLQTICEKDLETKQWPSLFKDTMTYLNSSERKLRDQIDLAKKNICDQMEKLLSSFAKEVQKRYLIKMKSIDILNLLQEINKEKSFLIEELGKIRNSNAMEDQLKIFCEIQSNLNIHLPMLYFRKLSKIVKSILYLESLSKKRIIIGSLPWINAMDELIAFFQEHETWYAFLNDLHSKFSEYEIQKETELYNVKDIDDWGKVGKPSGIQINSENFALFLSKLATNFAPESFAKHSMNKFKLQELNHVLRLTLKDKIQISSRGSSIIFRGDYIRLKTIFKENEIISLLFNIDIIESVHFMAFHTIFIDEDLQLKGKKCLSIFAPKWEIIGTRTIDLSNIKGKPVGVFLGFCNKLINRKNLKILSHEIQIKGTGIGESKAGNMFFDVLPLSKIKDYTDEAFYKRGNFREDNILGFLLGSVLVKEFVEIRTLFSGIKKIEKSSYDVCTIAFTLPNAENLERISSGNDPSSQNKAKGTPFEALKDEMEKLLFVADYRLEQIQNLNDRFKKLNAFQILRFLDNCEDIRNSYGVKEFFYELLQLEFQHDKMNGKMDFVPFYRSLHRRAWDYVQYLKSNSENSSWIQAELFLMLIYPVILTRMNESFKKSYFYVTSDINEPLMFVKEYLESLNETQRTRNKTEILKSCVSKYKRSIDLKIERIKILMDTQFLTELEDMRRNIDSKIDELIEEIVDLQKKFDTECVDSKSQFDTGRQTWRWKREELQSFLLVRMVIEFLEVIRKTLSILGPVGSEIVSFIEDNEEFRTRLLKDDESTVKEPIAEHLKAHTDLLLINIAMESIKNKNYKNLKEIFDEFLQELVDYPESFKDSVIFQKALDDILEYKFDFKKIKKLENDLNRELNRERNLVESESLRLENDNKIPNLIKKYIIAMKLLTINYDLYKNLKMDETKMKIIDSVITEAESKIHWMQLHEENIYQSLFTMMKNMLLDIWDTVCKTHGLQKTDFDIIRWQVQKNLENVRIETKRFTRDIKINHNLALYIERLEETTISLIHLYDRLQNFQELSDLVSYTVIFESMKLDIDFLMDLYNKRNLLNQFKKLQNVFRQWSFPFGYLYTEQNNLPSLSEFQCKTDHLMAEVKEQVENTAANISKHKLSVQNYDMELCVSEFHSRYVSSQPFFAWKNEQYGDIISKLLSGEKVFLKSDIINSPGDKDAIKLTDIDLYFRADSQDMQLAIEEALKRFKIRATHLGNSYYRCDDTYYVIPSDEQIVEWSFEKSDTGEPIDKNRVYDKIKSGDLSLSPYTMWEFQLIPVKDSISVIDLECYEHKVNLELIGRGSYLTKQMDFSHLMLEELYSEFKVELD